MKVSFNWLKEHVEIDATAREIAELLTMSGLEVEGLEEVGGGLQDVLACSVLTAAPHPDADRLFVCRVDAGGESRQVVCGAPNVEAGMKAALALPGVRLPGGRVIEESRIRGVPSSGMLLAEDEMGLTEDHSGILRLPDAAVPGVPLPSVLPVEDWVLEVGLTPNRGDCASIRGIAREIAALTGRRVKDLNILFEENGPPIETLAGVEIVDPVGCPRYAAGLIQGIVPKPSPFRMRYRLQLCGIRAINHIVDVTNYVLLEMGQPLHAFDYDRLRGHRIVVRRAAPGEAFTTLDGQSRQLSPQTLMICDAERSVALAGIMGGLNSEIFEGTRSVLIESACFDPITIRRGAKGLGIATEASYRFERGIDIENVVSALRRAMLLMTETGGGQAAKGIIDRYPRRFAPRTIDLRVDRTNRFLGTSIPGETMISCLKGLGLEVEKEGDQRLRVRSAAFRPDLLREVDLMEEIARLYGYDKIPVTIPKIRSHATGDAHGRLLREKVLGMMVGMGFIEVITYSFISPGSVEALGYADGSPERSFVRLLNPLTEEQSVMRTSLIPGLLASIQANRSRGERTLKLFEIGKIFLARGADELPMEPFHLAAVLSGPYRDKTWYSDERPVDFYDVKGAAEALLKGLGLPEISFARSDPMIPYDAEASAVIAVSGERLGQLGRIEDQALLSYDLGKGDLFALELDLEPLRRLVARERTFEPLAKYPAVFRDISIVLRREVESGRITDLIRRLGGDLVESVGLFDVYEGKGLHASEKALAFRIAFRSREGTLGGEEVNRLVAAIVEGIGREVGGRLRDGGVHVSDPG
jgi:phenylalanyl-tRNA synthetase beta chain